MSEIFDVQRQKINKIIPNSSKSAWSPTTTNEPTTGLANTMILRATGGGAGVVIMAVAVAALVVVLVAVVLVAAARAEGGKYEAPNTTAKRITHGTSSVV